MANFRPEVAVVTVDVAFNVPDRDIVSQSVLENLFYQQFLGDCL